MSNPGSTPHLLRRALGAYAKLKRGEQRLRALFHSTLEGALTHALTPAEKLSVTIDAYNQAPKSYESTRSLWEWERVWFPSALPTPPANVLLCAAGSGREAVWLLGQGYRVDAFEPAEPMATQLRAVVGERGDTAVGDFEALIEAVLDAKPTNLGRFAARKYDAVVLGWGSFGHVLDARDRERLLRACAALAPNGPILASFFLDPHNGAPREGRGLRLGRAIGRRVARWRRLAEPERDDSTRFTLHGGFVRYATRAEIEELAGRVGRELRWGSGAYPHVTFVPRRTGERGS